jgi:hypothetical protein
MTPELVAYADLAADPLVADVRALDAHPEDGAAALAVARHAFATGETVAFAVASRVLASAGPFARAARAGLGADDPRLRRAARELGELGQLAHADHRRRLAAHGLEDCLPDVGGRASTALDRPPAHARLLDRLLHPESRWEEQAADLASFHLAEGTGPLAAFRVLRLAGGRLAGVAAPDPLGLGDLVGGEGARAPLLGDLRLFVEGGRPNDALLYGPPGTGKSATVRAAAGAYGAAGLRLVQIDRDQVARLADAFALLAGAGPRCLLFLDDIVFDDDGRTDRALRAALEGGVEERPANVLLWATSNRLRLTADSRSERADALDEGETRGEKGALAERFGRRVRFGRPGQEEYLEVARRLVAARLGALPDGLDAAALRFARTGHGLSPRTARQFAASYTPADG